MVTGVQDVYVNVADMARAVAFYRDVLGLTVTDEDAYFTGLSAGGVRVGLHWNGDQPVPEIPKDAHGPHAGASLTFRVADIQAAKMALEESGVAVIAFTEHEWGKIVVFEDPDGNMLKVMEPPETGQ